jgi:rhodanese-related sulfurtransferase
MKSYDDLVNEVLGRIREVMPWDLGKQMAAGRSPLLLDVREPCEYNKLRIPGSINVPRGVLEQSCEWDYDETVPELAAHRERDIVVICRSGKRSALAADVMQQMGFTQVSSLRLGIRGWNDAELPLEDKAGNAVDADAGDVLLEPCLTAAQRKPKNG